jgi:hypothetical protein
LNQKHPKATSIWTINRKLGMGIAGNMIQVPKGLNVRIYPVAASSCRILCTCLDVRLVVEPSIHIALPVLTTAERWIILGYTSSNLGSYQPMSKENRNTIHPGLELAYYMFIPFYTYIGPNFSNFEYSVPYNFPVVQSCPVISRKSDAPRLGVPAPETKAPSKVSECSQHMARLGLPSSLDWMTITCLVKWC